jgi:hypothetical protein
MSCNLESPGTCTLHSHCCENCRFTGALNFILRQTKCGFCLLEWEDIGLGVMKNIELKRSEEVLACILVCNKEHSLLCSVAVIYMKFEEEAKIQQQ